MVFAVAMDFVYFTIIIPSLALFLGLSTYIQCVSICCGSGAGAPLRQCRRLQTLFVRYLGPSYHDQLQTCISQGSGIRLWRHSLDKSNQGARPINGDYYTLMHVEANIMIRDSNHISTTHTAGLGLPRHMILKKKKEKTYNGDPKDKYVAKFYYTNQKYWQKN